MTAIQSVGAVASHAQEILRLKRLFNAHSRIGRLPAHILALIFLEHATTFYKRRLAYYYGVRGEHIGDATHKDLYSWTTVAHVCRHWREVAVNYAQLWTFIVLDERVSPHFIELLLKRSCGLPLNVVLHSIADRYHCSNCRAHAAGSNNYGDAVKMLPVMLPNIRKLSIFIEREDHAEIWEALQHLDHATKLESLHFGGVGGASIFTRVKATVEIPDRLSSQIPPNLSSLEIWGTRILWENSLYCASLRSLKICRYLCNPDAHLGHLLAALKNTPRLESLILDQIPPARSGEDYHSVTLSGLRKMQIPLDAEHGANLLSSLDIPSSTSILFSDSLRARHDCPKILILKPSQHAILMSIARLLGDTTVYAISYAEFVDYSVSAPCLQIWAVQQADAQVKSSAPFNCIDSTPPRLAINARLDSPFIAQVLAALDLKSVRTIKIADESMRRSRPFIEAFHGADNLTCLCLRGEVAFPVGAVLSGWSRPAHLDAEKRKQVEEHMKRVLAGEVERQADLSWDVLPPSWYGFGEVDETNPDARIGDDTPASNEHVPREGSPLPCGGPYPLFPHLQTLVLESVEPLLDRYDEGTIWDDPDGFQLHNKSLNIQYGFPTKGLARSLQLRTAAGVSEVVRVEFKDCQRLEKERLMPLVGVVPTVVYEGKCLTEHGGH
ncbi:hypothetical protein K466DRAFT_658871 [Polyporus arcularius HHB13444]|uniref:Uncharacterized protein n=1 Tax=Polyporus arcularius HHB13444 TaxID=1314778 RepID=A0A5C3PW16_9APHY|nr:hypothetical protein K466DRAFT_658871 [Polyporus arcularius HHB13444]